MGTWTKWTKELILQKVKECTNARDFHDRFRGAEKAADRLGIRDQLFPNKEIHRVAYTKEDLIAIAAQVSTRSDLQRLNPSAYNAAKALGLIDTLFPVQLNRKKTYLELKLAAERFSCRSEFERGAPKEYQVAQKRKILDEICPPKMQGTSLAEIELLEFLQKLNSDFKTRRFANDYELDCYSESLKLGVEYNGFYWHSEANRGRSYHRAKTQYFENMGIRVIHVWEDEWKNRKEQVKDFLRSACGKNCVRIGARKCVFRAIEKDVARKFLDNTHIQGGLRNISVAIGCFYSGKLIGVATFGAHHRNNNDTVLNRFACLPDHTVCGFLAKATKIAYKEFGPLLSWADYSKSQARGYLAAGWTAVKIHPPDYFYVNSKGERVSKQSRKKSNAGTPAGMTEAQHAAKDGLYRIWDCGKILLQYKQIS